MSEPLSLGHFVSLLMERDYVPPPQHRFGGDVVVEYRWDPAGAVRVIRKTHSGRLCQGHEYEAMSLVAAARVKRCVHGNVLTDSVQGSLSIEMKDHGLDLGVWGTLLGFGPTSPLNEPAVLLVIWREVLEALHEFHSAGLVHGDVKEDNICLPTRGRVTCSTEGVVSATLLCKKLTLIDLGFSLPKVLTSRTLWTDAHGAPYWVGGPHVSPHYSRVQEIAHARRDPTLLNYLDWRIDLFSTAHLVEDWSRRLRVQGRHASDGSGRNRTAADRLLAALPRRLREFDTDPQALAAPAMPHLRLIAAIDDAIGADAFREIAVKFPRPAATNGQATTKRNEAQPLSESLIARIAAEIGLSTPPSTHQPLPRSPIMDATTTKSGQFDFVIDGSNALLHLALNGAPSVRLFCAMLAMLDRNGKRFKVWFDKSIYHHIEERGGDLELFRWLVDALNRAQVLGMEAWADPHIAEDCKKHAAPVINGTDNNTSWTGYFPPIIRCTASASRDKGAIALILYPAGGGEKLMQTDAAASFQFAGQTFQALGAGSELVAAGLRRMAPEPDALGRKDYGNLLVLALDASKSMNTPDTHNGVARHKLVTDTVRQLFSVEGLGASSIGRSLWIAVLSFGEDIRVVRPGEEEGVFFPLKHWMLASESVDYTAGVAREATNIRLALDRAAAFIEEFVQKDREERKLAKKWQTKTVVMLTDGEHQLGVNGQVEKTKDIHEHVYRTVHRAADVRFGFIGLGQGADNAALNRWASQASPQQLDMAQTRQVVLQGSALHVVVDPKAADAATAIRAFIDVVSSKAVQ